MSAIQGAAIANVHKVYRRRPGDDQGRSPQAGLVLNALISRGGRRSLSPFVRHHVNMLGRYSFQLPDLPGVRARLRESGAGELR